MSPTKDEAGLAEHVDITKSDVNRTVDQQDYDLTTLQTIRKYPLSVAWTLFAIATCLLVSFENQAGGMVLGIPQFRADFGYEIDGGYVLDAGWQSAFYGGPIAGAVAGTFGAGYLADKLGRKPIMIGAIIVSYGAIALEFVATKPAEFFGGKLINGVVAGVLLTVSVSYVGEVSPSALRGILTCATGLVMALGPMIAAVIVDKTGDSTSRWAYRAIFCSQFAFTGFCTLFAPFMPESPVWLVTVDKPDKAARSLTRLGFTGTALEMRLSQIRSLIEEAKHEAEGATFLDCFRRSNLRRTIISVMPLAIQALSGVFFVGSYGTYYIQLAGYSVSASFKLQITQHGLSMLGNICSWFLIDRVGRRTLTFWGTFSITAILLVFAGLAAEGSPGAIRGSVGLILIYNFFYNVSIGATAYTLLCEVATSSLRAKTISIGIALQYVIYGVWAFVIPYAFNPDQGNLGGKTGFIFGALGVLCLVYLWFYQPETANLSYEELDELFAKGVSVRDFDKYRHQARKCGDDVEMEGSPKMG
ncbi:related to maltose permease [Cephalotrichum gorgonifer]|uniref:Related to maltose permease n=1 Tax=Cephalotrichum gorgonifer TaxID=2041049 RepID=A0AAE8N8G5_9PEZI|nr:related to maltose permease [Cephalotrichum gorgonifer]